MTPREILHWTKSVEGEDRRRWAHTAQICALFANAHRAKGKRPFRPADFYPYEVEASSGPDLTREEIDALRQELELLPDGNTTE
jgi:hypothetical protein